MWSICSNYIFFPPLARLFMVMCLHHQDLKLEKCFNGMNLLEFLSMEILLIFFTKLSPKFKVNHICKFSPKLPAGTSKKNQAKNKNQRNIFAAFSFHLSSYVCVYVRTSTGIIGAKNLITSFVHGQHTKLNIETHAENM